MKSCEKMCRNFHRLAVVTTFWNFARIHCCCRRRRRRLDLTLMMTSRLFPERDPGQVNFVSTESVFNLRLDPVSRKLEIQSVPDFGSAPKIMLR